MNWSTTCDPRSAPTCPFSIVGAGPAGLAAALDACAPRHRALPSSNAGPGRHRCRARPRVSTRTMELMRAWGLEDGRARRRQRRRVAALVVRDARADAAAGWPVLRRPADDGAERRPEPDRAGVRPAGPPRAGARAAPARARPPRRRARHRARLARRRPATASSPGCATRTAEERVVHARYVVAADGAHSTVRRRSASRCAAWSALADRIAGAVPRAAVGRRRRAPLRPLQDAPPAAAHAFLPAGRPTAGSTASSGSPTEERLEDYGEARVGAIIRRGGRRARPAAARSSGSAPCQFAAQLADALPRRTARSWSATPRTGCRRAAGRA